MSNAKPSIALATVIGFGGLLLWALAAVVVAKLRPIPTFELLSFSAFICFASTLLAVYQQKAWHKLRQPWYIWLIGILGVCGSEAAYVSAFKNAPPAQAELINYLWPILVILLSSLLPTEKLKLRHCIAGLLGLFSVYLLITNNHGLCSFNMVYMKGYGLAFLCALLWSTYTVLSRYFRETPAEMIGMYLGVGSLFFMLLHQHFETWVTPNSTEVVLIVVMGLTTSGLAYFLWDYGIKKGHMQLLSVLSYANPLIAVCLLIAFKQAHATQSLFLAASLVVAGAALGSYDLLNSKKTL